MNILFLSGWFPYPPNNGSKLRIYNLLLGLSREHDITLITFSDQPDIDAGCEEINLICKKVILFPWKPYNPRSLNAILGFFSSKPRSIVNTFSMEAAVAVSRFTKSGEIDLVIASELTMASYAPYFYNVPAVYEGLELGVPIEAVQKAKNKWTRLRSQITWRKQQKFLLQLFQYYKAITVVSDKEREIFSELFTGFNNIYVVPNCIDVNSYLDIVANTIPGRLIFTGSFRYGANHDAMVWFTNEVFPKIKAEIPDVELVITGDHANKPLPNHENVRLTGYVPDIVSEIAQSWCSLAPLQIGGGTRLKILESMAIGTPVVSTSKGAEGLDFVNGEHILIADEPDQFAALVVQLLENPLLRDRLSKAAYKVVKEKYDWSKVTPGFLKMLDELLTA